MRMGFRSRQLIFAAAIFGCSALAQPGLAQLKSQAASVVLIARMPETAGVQWTLPPVPPSLESPGMNVGIVVLQSQWHFAAGETVTAECRLADTTDGEAELIALNTAGKSPGAYATGFLSRPATTEAHLLERFDPLLGAQKQTDALLVVGPQMQPPRPRVLHVVVTAL
jgi:hypothetical protein